MSLTPWVPGDGQPECHALARKAALGSSLAPRPKGCGAQFAPRAGRCRLELTGNIGGERSE